MARGAKKLSTIENQATDTIEETPTMPIELVDTPEPVHELEPDIIKKAGKRGRKNKQIEKEQAQTQDTENNNNLEVIQAPTDISLDKESIVVLENVEHAEVSEFNNDSNNDDGSIKTKRRGRKPKDKFKYETADIDEYSRNNKKDDNVIIKLPLSCLKLNEEFNLGKDLFPYNPVITTPKPYNPEHFKGGNIGYSLLGYNSDTELDEDNIDGIVVSLDGATPDKDNKSGKQQSITNKCQNCQCHRNGIESTPSMNKEKDKDKDARQIDIILNNKYYTNTDKFNVLTHLGGCMNGDKWPEKTEIPCLWDCHQFKNTPWGVPYKFTNDKFQLFGNFCSANCVLSYILHYYVDDDALWEKVALLNLLYFKVYKEYKSIVPAFDKMGLKMFGGPLEIDEYRNITSANDKAYGVEFPPCNTIIPMLEEIYKKTNLNNTFIPVDKTRLQVANNELKLKRSKPVVNHKNTLDFCLGKA